MSQNIYQKRKAMGVCVDCGKNKPVEGILSCEKCRIKNNKRHTENRVFYQSLGLCGRCGKNKLFGNEKECPECLAMMYAINIKSRKIHAQTGKDYYHREMKRLKENGMCRGCRKKKREEGHTYCTTCLIKKRERSRRDRMKKEKPTDRSERVSNGLCYFCGNPIDRDGRSCKSCAERNTKNLPLDIGGKNEYWRQQNKLIGKKGQ